MKIRLLLSSIAFVFGSGILLISLFMSASQVSSSGQNSSDDHQLYFNRTILPDHMLYPALMVVDRIQLEAASDYERVFKDIEYAHRRLEYSEELLTLGKPDLALTTLTKAEKYLANAVHDAQAIQAPDSVMQRIEKAIEYHNKRLKELSPQFTSDADRAVIDRHLSENEALLKSLTQ
jgi:hypothetical protein